MPSIERGDEQAARIEALRGILASQEADRAYFAERLKTERKMIAKLEADVAQDLAVVDGVERLSHETLGILARLLAGERVGGDDEAAVNHVIAVANKRDAKIRAAPRPAARGRRGRQKRPRWLRLKESAAAKAETAP